MDKDLMKTKNKKLQLVVMLLTIIFIIGMGGGLVGNKVNAESTTKTMYGWEFNYGKYNSQFNDNTLIAQNGGAIINGKLVMGPVDSAKTGMEDSSKCYKLSKGICLGSKDEKTTWSLSTKFSVDDVNAFDGLNKSLQNGIMLCTSLLNKNNGEKSRVGDCIWIKRPSSDDAYNKSPDTLMIVFGKSISGNYEQVAAYIPGISDEALKKGIEVETYMSRSGAVYAKVTDSDLTTIKKAVDVSVQNGKYNENSSFDFNSQLEFDTIGSVPAYFNSPVSIDYLEVNVTKNDDGSYTNSITGDSIKTAMITVDNTIVKVIDNGDNTYSYNGVKYQYNPTTQKYEVYTDQKHEIYTVTHVIKYNMNNGINSSLNPVTYVEGEGVTFVSPKRAGFKFAGWTDAFGVMTTNIASKDSSDVLLTANWVSNRVGIRKVVVGKKKVKVTWGQTINANTGYQISVNAKKKGTKVVGTVTKASSTIYKKTKLKKGKKYYIKVRAYKTVSGSRIYGDWSKVIKTAKVK